MNFGNNINKELIAPFVIEGLSSSGILNIRSNVNSNGLRQVLNIFAENNSGFGANNIGSRINFYNENDAGTNVLSSALIFRMPSAVAGAESSNFIIRGMNNGVDETQLQLGATGQLKLDKYTTSSSFTGTPVGYLQYDASGNIITSAVPFSLPSLTNGSVLFSNGTTIAQDNATFFWDNTNKRLGLGTITPQARLEVQGSGLVGVFGTTSNVDQYIQFRQGASGVGFFGLDASLNGGLGGYLFQAGDNKTFNFATGSDIFGAVTPMMTIKGDSVGIGNVDPNTSSALDITSTTKGLLIPRMTTAERDAIGTPVTGLTIYNTSTNTFDFHSTSWRSLVDTFNVQTIGGNKTFSGAIRLSSSLNELFVAGTSSDNANFSIRSGNFFSSTTAAQFQLLGSTSMSARLSSYTATNSVLSTLGISFATFVFGNTPITEATSGTHFLFSQLAIKPLNVTDGAATTTNGATLYIEGAATGTATITNNYSLWVDDGTVRLDGEFELQNIPSATESNVLYYNTTTKRVSYGAPGGGGVSDGDKGDITVSSSGTVWTIDNGVIDIANLSATGTPSASNYLLGDNTWGTLSILSLGLLSSPVITEGQIAYDNDNDTYIGRIGTITSPFVLVDNVSSSDGSIIAGLTMSGTGLDIRVTSPNSNAITVSTSYEASSTPRFIDVNNTTDVTVTIEENLVPYDSYSEFTIKKVSNNANTVTITSDKTGQNIDGATTVVLREFNETITIRRSSFISGWDIISRNNNRRISVGTTAPASPAVGDLWVDTN